MTRESFLKQYENNKKEWRIAKTMLRIRYSEKSQVLPTYAVYGGNNDSGVRFFTEANTMSGYHDVPFEQIEEISVVTELFVIMMLNNFMRQ